MLMLRFSIHHERGKQNFLSRSENEKLRKVPSNSKAPESSLQRKAFSA